MLRHTGTLMNTSLLDTFVSYEENEVLRTVVNTDPGVVLTTLHFLRNL